MKERPIFPLLVSMALPMVLSMTVNALYNIVDSFFVAQISEQAMTALSLVYPVQNMINAIAIGFGVGINALIALYSGAGGPLPCRYRRHPRPGLFHPARPDCCRCLHRHDARLSAAFHWR